MKYRAYLSKEIKEGFACNYVEANNFSNLKGGFWLNMNNELEFNYSKQIYWIPAHQIKFIKVIRD